MDSSLLADSVLTRTSLWTPFPLLSLPVEVIGDILTICAASEPPRPGSLGFIRLGHVCSTLRRILLDISHLWASSVFKLPAGNDELLKRAQNTPLVIDLLEPAYRHDTSVAWFMTFSESYLELLNANLSRARSIALPPSISYECLNALRTSEFPFLTKATLVFGKDHAQYPTQLSLTHAPLLRHLSMRNCIIFIDHSVLESLSVRFQGHGGYTFHLPIHVPNLMQEPPFDAQAVLRSIRLATNLRKLLINGSLFRDVVKSSPIALLHLEDLHVNATYSFCSSLWNIISIPPMTRLVIHVDGYRHRDWPVAHLEDIDVQQRLDFMGAVARHFSRPGAPRISGIRLDCTVTQVLLFTPRTGAVMRELRGPFSVDHALVLDIRVAKIDCLLNMSVAAPLAFLEQVPRQIDLSYPITFELSKLGKYSTTHWHQSLIHMDVIHTLVLDEFPPRAELWDAICPSISSTSDIPPVFPRLRVVYFAFDTPPPGHRELSFSSSNGSDSELSEPSRGNDSMPELTTVSDTDSDCQSYNFLAGEDRMRARFGYESGHEDGGDGHGILDDGAADEHVDPRNGVGQTVVRDDTRSSRPVPWRNFVDGLERRVIQGLGVEQVVFEPYSDYISDSVMLRLKKDIAAVVPEVVEI